MVQLSYVKDNINQFSAVYRVIDFSIIQIILLICIKSYSIQLSDTYVMIGLIATIAFFVVAESIQLYRSWRTSNALRLPLYTFASWVVAVFAVTTFLFFSKTSVEISRLVIGFWFVLTCVSLISWRLAVRVYLFKRRRMGFNSRKVAIFGLTHSGVELANQFQNSPEAGFTLSAFFDDRDTERLPNQFNDKLQGDVNHGVEQARSGRFNAVYIALPLDAQKRIESILRSLGDTTVDVHLVPDNFIGNLLHARTSYVGNIQTISVYESPLNLFTSMAKRLEDIIGSIMILCGIAIPMLIIAMLIKVDSSGPVFFKQKRYGLDGKAINVWKFRSMTVADNGDVVKQATKGDARITKLGAMLRRTSLDELPQFINVLQGQMSIVGPRPHAVAHNEQYRSQVDFYMLRHKVKPGITGWAQINGWRGETDTLDKMEKRIEFDLEYIRNWSILLDLRIIFLTIFKGFVNKNAY